MGKWTVLVVLPESLLNVPLLPLLVPHLISHLIPHLVPLLGNTIRAQCNEGPFSPRVPFLDREIILRCSGKRQINGDRCHFSLWMSFQSIFTNIVESTQHLSIYLTQMGLDRHNILSHAIKIAISRHKYFKAHVCCCCIKWNIEFLVFGLIG